MFAGTFVRRQKISQSCIKTVMFILLNNLCLRCPGFESIIGGLSLLIVFYEEIELGLSPGEGLAGIVGRQGGERACGICMAESELTGPQG